MPRLPTADQLGQRPTPSPRGGISQLNLVTPRRGAEAAALADFGKSMQEVGNTLAVLAAKEKEQMDGARTEEAYTDYQNGLLEFELGEQEGFANLRAGDAVKESLVEKYRDKRKQLKDQIRNKLGNDDQRIGFDRRADIADRQFDSRLYKHVADESRAYQNVVSEGLLATERQMAALNWSQPGQIEMSILRSSMEIERKAKLDGFDPERDREVVDTLKIIAETQIHSSVVNQMILQGQDAAASAYYETIKDRLTPEAIVTLGSKVTAASVDGEAIRGADLVWSMLGPQEVNDPVRLDIMERWIRDRYSEKPEEMRAAIQDLRSRAQAHGDGQREYRASNQAEVLNAFHDGATLKDLQQMPEYHALDGEAKMKLREYITNTGWTEQQRARQEASYREGEKAARGFQAYWELSNPAVLSGISEKEILALEPELGRTLTEDLVKAKRKLTSPDKVRAATIDTEQFNVLAAEAGLKPYAQKKSAVEKEYLGRLKNQVETAIDIAQSETGRALSREEKGKIMQAEIDKKVMLDEWGRDPSMPAAVLRPEQRESVYVPIAEIDQDWMKGAINYMRSEGVVPVDWTDDEIKKATKGRLERAYASSITGGSSEEGKAILLEGAK